jgi:hypothetical protein
LGHAEIFNGAQIRARRGNPPTSLKETVIGMCPMEGALIRRNGCLPL